MERIMYATGVNVQLTLVTMTGMGVRELYRHRAGQGRAGQGRAGQGRAGQGKAGQGRARQGRWRTGYDEAAQSGQFA